MSWENTSKLAIRNGFICVKESEEAELQKINREEYELLKSLNQRFKWLARDINNTLWIYGQEPYKGTNGTWQPRGTLVLEVDGNLFQFIQWEDEEPYNIQELIEEYEFEVKNIEWFKEEIKVFQEGKDMFTAEFNAGVQDTLEYVEELLDQLDEPETLSQEWIDKNVMHVRGLGYIIGAEAVENILVSEQEITFEQVYDKLREESILSEKSFDYYWNCISDNVEIDEPGNLLVPKLELPVIPQFVADWIEFKKKSGIAYENVFQVIDELVKSHTSKAHNWVLKTNENKDTFARAWLYGYTVEEEEQRYYLKTPYYKRGKNLYVKDLKNGLIEIRENVKEAKKYSENEIKRMENGNVLFEHFAVKIEELEE